MKHYSHKDKTERFLSETEEMSTTLIIGIMVLSLGLYSIIWIYNVNKKLSEHDRHSPESSRGLSVLIILPLIWIFLNTLIKTLLFTSTPMLYEIFEIGIWGFIYFLIIKYLFDLIESYTNTLKSEPIVWNSLFLIGLVGTIGIILQKPYLYPFLIGIIFAITGMQNHINSLIKSHSIKNVGSKYYKR